MATGSKTAGKAPAKKKAPAQPKLPTDVLEAQAEIRRLREINSTLSGENERWKIESGAANKRAQWGAAAEEALKEALLEVESLEKKVALLQGELENAHRNLADAEERAAAGEAVANALKVLS